jgi:hypothetical protein
VRADAGRFPSLEYRNGAQKPRGGELSGRRHRTTVRAGGAALL